MNGHDHFGKMVKKKDERKALIFDVIGSRNVESLWNSSKGQSKNTLVSVDTFLMSAQEIVSSSLNLINDHRLNSQLGCL